MKHLATAKVLLAFVVVGLFLYVLIFVAATNTVINVSAVETNGVGVYWNSGCSNRVSSISWGTLQPGGAKNIAVYIRNEAGEPVYLFLSTTNWNPTQASQYLALRWNYSLRRVNPGEILQTKLTLSVSRYIVGISSFSFDIVINGSNRLPGDLDGDGYVSGLDMGNMGLALFTSPGDSRWNPNADIDGDGYVGGIDIGIAGMYLFQSG